MARYKAVAEYYDPEYAHLDYLQKDVPFLLSKMPKRRQQVLELAVGTGRAAIPLAQSGHRVVGIDYDPKILAIARRKRDFVGLTEKELQLRQADIRSFRSRGKFDWCIILFNTLLAFASPKEMGRVLATCRRCLRPGGRLWIDIFNPDLPLLAEGHSYGLDPVTFHVPGLDRTVSRVTDLEDVSPQVRRVTFRYHWFEEGEERNVSRAFEMTWMMPRELAILLERHGFTLERQWGDYDGSKVSNRSPRIIAQAKRGMK